MENRPIPCACFSRRPALLRPPQPSPHASLVKKRVEITPTPSPPSRSTTTVPYETAADAEAVRATLAVDNELQPDKVTKTLRVEGKNLVACVPRPKAKKPASEQRKPDPLDRPAPPAISAPSRAYLDPPLSRRSEFAATEPRLLRAPPSPRSWTFSISLPAPSRSSVTSPSPRHPVARRGGGRGESLRLG